MEEPRLNLIFGRMMGIKGFLNGFSTPDPRQRGTCFALNFEPGAVPRWRGSGVEKQLNKVIPKIFLTVFLLSSSSLKAQMLEHIFIHTDKQIYVTGETVWMSLYCLDGNSHQLSEISSVAYVELVDDQGEALNQTKIQLIGGRGAGQFFISPALLSNVHYLRAYTRWSQNSPSNAVSEIPLFVVNPSDPPTIQQISQSNKQQFHSQLSNTNIKLSKLELGRRQELSITLNGIESPASLSISVHKIGADNSSANTAPFIHKHSLFKYIEEAKSLPVTNWQELSAKLTNQSFNPPELKSQSIIGKLPEDFRGKLFLSFPGENMDLYAVPVKTGGYFNLELSSTLKQQEVMFWSLGDQIFEEELEIFSPFVEKSVFEPVDYFIPQGWHTLIESWSRNAQINHLYSSYTNIKGLNQVSPSFPFYEQSAEEYELDAFTRFPNLEEVFLEYINRAQNRKIGRKSYIHVWDEYQNIFSNSNFLVFDTAALVFLDGVPLLDPDFIWNFDVLKLKKIDIVPKRYFAGDKMFAGVIHFQTYKNDFGGKDIPDYVITRPFIPMQTQTHFFSPDYSDSSLRNKRIPDFRTTLYWNPLWDYKNSNQSISLYTGDDTGLYLVEVHGISQNGTPIYARSEFEVTANSQH